MIRCIALVASLALAACIAEPSPEDIEGMPWRLVQLGAQPIMPDSSERAAHLVLQPAAGRATGSGGCNRFTGSYRAGADSLEFGPLAATKMACLEGGAEEAAFLDALSQARRWSVTGRQLTLTDAAGTVLLRFETMGP